MIVFNKHSNAIFNSRTSTTNTELSPSLVISVCIKFPVLPLIQKAPEQGPGFPSDAPSKLHLKIPKLGNFHYTT